MDDVCRESMEASSISESMEDTRSAVDNDTRAQDTRSAVDNKQATSDTDNFSHAM